MLRRASSSPTKKALIGGSKSADVIWSDKPAKAAQKDNDARGTMKRGRCPIEEDALRQTNRALQKAKGAIGNPIAPESDIWLREQDLVATTHWPPSPRKPIATAGL